MYLLLHHRTCGFLNPEVINKGEILQSFIEQDLKIINLRTIQLTESVACELLKEYEDESLVRYFKNCFKFKKVTILYDSM